jgi:hypothetical protein
MEKAQSGYLIENENLFRSFIYALIAILFVMLSVNSFQSDGIVLFKFIYVILGLCSSLATLAYAAYFTNDYFSAKEDGDGH